MWTWDGENHPVKHAVLLRIKGGFRKKWINLYFVRHQGTDKVMCKQVNSAVKEFNVERHFDPNHKSHEFMGEERKHKVEQFQQPLCVCISPVWPSIICYLPKLALSHQNFENPWFICMFMCICMYMGSISIICFRVPVCWNIVVFL